MDPTEEQDGANEMIEEIETHRYAWSDKTSHSLASILEGEVLSGNEMQPSGLRLELRTPRGESDEDGLFQPCDPPNTPATSFRSSTDSILTSNRSSKFSDYPRGPANTPYNTPDFPRHDNINHSPTPKPTRRTVTWTETETEDLRAPPNTPATTRELSSLPSAIPVDRLFAPLSPAAPRLEKFKTRSPKPTTNIWSLGVEVQEFALRLDIKHINFETWDDDELCGLDVQLAESIGLDQQTAARLVAKIRGLDNRLKEKRAAETTRRYLPLSWRDSSAASITSPDDFNADADGEATPRNE